ncbi:type II secretion system protein [Escherichia coli]
MNSLSRTQKPRAGFTLLEVMVVIVILGVLASLVVPNLLGNKEKGLRSAESHQRYRGAGKRTGYVPTG